MEIFDAQFARKSEMDSTARVLLVVAEVVRHFPYLKVELQPTYKGFKFFTDVLFVISDQGQPILLIEVKRPGISTELDLQDQGVAQVLCKVHIAMEKEKLPFVFTNGQIWSIGIAEKVGTKFRVPTLYHHHVLNLSRVGGQDFQKLLGHLKALIELSIDCENEQ